MGKLLDDLGGLFNLGREVAEDQGLIEPRQTHRPTVAGVEPSLTFQCTCGTRLVYGLEHQSPEDVLREVVSHLQTCSAARGHIGSP